MSDFQAVNPAVLADERQGWRRMLRIENTGGDVQAMVQGLHEFLPDKVVYAEGDSWFDKFTPLNALGTNLLDAVRTPFHAAVVDASHIGHEVAEMVTGRQRRQTETLFRLQGFDAIVLSAGGNDLKNIFASVFEDMARRRQGLSARWPADKLFDLSRPQTYRPLVTQVVDNVARFVALRDEARNERTRNALVLVHGYDYFQPRPARALLFAGSRIGAGPWLYPSMHDAGMTDAQMRAAADAVIDELNEQLLRRFGSDAGVQVLDQRGLLTPAEPGSTGAHGDWLDEIHPSRQGFTTLVRNRWDVALARALGWEPAPGDLVAALPPSNPSTAVRGGPAGHA